jgi:GH24 family phage-related lysozyme (muramidase)
VQIADYRHITTATEPGEVARDLTEYVLRARQDEGTAPATRGITVPMGDVQDVPSMMREIGSWNSELKTRKGGSAMDTMETPDSDTYARRRYDFISQEEGVRRFAYDDKTGKTVTPDASAQGKVTVGVGFNMDAPDARKNMTVALGFGTKEFDDVRSGKRALTDAEVRRLFDYNIRQAEDLVRTKVGDAPISEHQRLALVSMAFNGQKLIGPQISAAAASGDTKSVLNEMLYNSGKNPALFGRRYREAALYAGPTNSDALPSFADYVNKRSGKTLIASR